MKRFLFAVATAAFIVLAIQITAYGGTTTVTNYEWSSSSKQNSATVTFDMDMEFSEPLKKVHGFLLTNFHNTDEITEMANASQKWMYMTFASEEPDEGAEANISFNGRSIRSLMGPITAWAWYETDYASGMTRIHLNGQIVACGSDLTGLAILGELEDGTLINVWGRKTGLSMINQHRDWTVGYTTINIVLKIPQEEYMPERGDVLFRFEIATDYENFVRTLKLSPDAVPSTDGYYYISDSIAYQSPADLSQSDKNTVTVRQKPSALYETDVYSCSTDVHRQGEVIINIERTEHLRQSGKTIYATGETH